MTDKKLTIIAYRCPHCGAGVMSAIDVFSLGSPMIKLKCSCRESELTLVKQDDGKINITVPCIICPKPHNFVLDPAVLQNKDEFLLPCPYSDMSACFIGDINYVRARLAQSELELLDLMEKNGISDFSAFREANTDDGDDAIDSELTQSILFVLSELEAENKIFCKCKDKKYDNEKYGYEISSEGVRVKCRDCGAEQLISTNNSLVAHTFLDADALYLK